MPPKKRFEIKFLKAALDFINSLDIKVRSKIQFNITKAQYEVDNELLKKLNPNIWEFRTKYQGMAYRLLAFWDANSKSLIICTHGFIKKDQKTPVKEIEKAESLMRLYYQQTNK